MVSHIHKKVLNKPVPCCTAFLELCVFAFALGTSSICNADDLAVILIESETPFSNQEKEQILQAIPSQHENPFSKQIISNILVSDISKSLFIELERAFQNAQNIYYNGEFEAAQSLFLSLHEQLKNAMPSATYQQYLSQMDRDTLVYLVMLAKELNNVADFNRYLKSIIRLYPRNAVPSKQFPPWVRDAIRKQQLLHPARAQSVSIKDVNKCELLVNGKRQTIRSSQLLLPPGEYTFETHCDDKRSFTSVVQVVNKSQEWVPLYYPGTRLIFAPDTLTVQSEKMNQPDVLLSFLTTFAQRLSQKKMFIAQKNSNEIQLSIFTPFIGFQSQVSIPTNNTDSNSLATRTTTLFDQLPSNSSDLHQSSIAQKKWYNKTLAWVLTATGASMAGIGLAMGIKHGTPSSREPAILALQISGTTLAISGITLFIIPQFEPNSDSIAIGLQTHFSF